MAVVDILGERFGSLTVTGRSERKSKAGALWVCLCDCGGETVTTSLKLRDGHTKSCGCRRAKSIIKHNLKHGQANKTRTYKTWKEMRQRCMNKNKDNFKWYGGRGIEVCAEWDDFKKFWLDMGDRPEDMTLDRIDSDGNYTPENCRWATAKQQAVTNRGCFGHGRSKNVAGSK